MLHSQAVAIPTGYNDPMFGFPMTTFCGSTPQDNRYVKGWEGVEEICFDPSRVYAHSEYEFAIMRMFGGFQA